MTKASVTLASADRGKLYRSPMQVRHGFASNELFRLDRLVELADDLHYLRYAPKLAAADGLRRELGDRSRKLLRGLR